jgi:A/G-specific adenine glycosylase
MPKAGMVEIWPGRLTFTPQQFADGLLRWNKEENRRQMPWKGEKDPYKIWLSEIILQQTRVEQGLKYYNSFVSTFPDVHALASAPEQEVFKLWEGLGYYSRCRNLIASAKYISSELGGHFPKDYEAILKLKGVGSYTASAIASFAYNLPYAVLDGNVFRVLSRIYGIETPIDSATGKKEFILQAGKTMPMDKAGEFNQAIMDFGATVCKPLPECAVCFFKDHCTAYANGQQDLLPVKKKKISVRQRWFNYFVIRFDGLYAIRQRMEKDIWQNLFEFVLIETEGPASLFQLKEYLDKQFALKQKEYKLAPALQLNQKLTHQLICFNLFVIHVKKQPDLPSFQWVSGSELKALAFPKTLQQFIVNELND